jgi:NAD(P)-dependent dehydrogenase (short-subunit alcohol dehydrogenase family)
MAQVRELFDLTGQTAVVTGGCGVLCFAIARGLADAGAQVALLDRQAERGQECACEIGEHAVAFYADVLDRTSLDAAAQQVVQALGPVSILVNCAGGNREDATTSEAMTFFDLPTPALESVFNLNFMGTLLPSQVFGRQMAAQKSGVILNISSMSAIRPLTRVVAYSAAKAAIVNFTQWLAVYMAQEYTPNVRVNAIAPGFFQTQQNRFLLHDQQTGELTERGRLILDHSPVGRFGTPEDLIGTVLWLVSPASAFVTGIVVPVDGGFSAFAGV